jgi:hypothetical protein
VPPYVAEKWRAACERDAALPVDEDEDESASRVLGSIVALQGGADTQVRVTCCACTRGSACVARSDRRAA